MTPVLDIETSRLVQKIIGEVETEKWWSYASCGDGCPIPSHVKGGWRVTTGKESHDAIPAPNFGELIRLLPLIGEKKGWDKITVCAAYHHETPPHGCSCGGYITNKTGFIIRQMATEYASEFAPTPQDGMIAVGAYLKGLLI